jgi:hypothetical protein
MGPCNTGKTTSIPPVNSAGTALSAGSSDSFGAGSLVEPSLKANNGDVAVNAAKGSPPVSQWPSRVMPTGTTS